MNTRIGFTARAPFRSVPFIAGLLLLAVAKNGLCIAPINVDSCGADPTMATDSSTAEQTCFNNACAAAANPTRAVSTIPVLQWSAGTYTQLKPLVIACDAPGNAQLSGQGSAQTVIAMKAPGIGQSYGPAIVVEPSNAISSLNGGVITGNSLAKGSGNSLYWASSAVPFSLHLDQIIHALGTPPLNGLGALDTRLFFKIGSLASTDHNGVALIDSDGRLDQSTCGFQSSLGGGWGCGGAFILLVDSRGAIHWQVNVGGKLVEVHSANGAVTTNRIHEVEGVFDGANVCLFLDGSRVETVARRGTLAQRPDEDMFIGEDMQFFPAGSPTSRIWYSGPTYVDSVEMRTAIPSGRNCANRSYRMDTTKFTGDADSILLLNFDRMYDISGVSTTTGPALIQADYFNGQPANGNIGAWLSVRNEGLVSGAGVYIHDLATYGNGVGIYDVTTQNNQFDNLLLLGSNYTGKFESNTGFNNESSNIRVDGVSGNVAAEIWTNGSGISKANNHVIATPACGWSCLLFGPGSSGTFRGFYVAPQSRTAWSFVVDNLGASPTSLHFDSFLVDAENGGSEGALFFEGPGSLTCTNCALMSLSATPLLTLGPNNNSNQTGDAVSLDGDALAIGAAAPEVVDQLDSAFFPGATPQVLIHNSLFQYANTILASSPPPGDSACTGRGNPFTCCAGRFTGTCSAVPWSNNNALVNVVPSGILNKGNQTGNFTCDFAGGQQGCSATLAANHLRVTLARPLINIPVSVRLCEDATGNRTPILAAGTGVAAIKLAGGSITLTATPNKCDQITFNYDGVNLREVARALNQ